MIQCFKIEFGVIFGIYNSNHITDNFSAFKNGFDPHENLFFTEKAAIVTRLLFSLSKVGLSNARLITYKTKVVKTSLRCILIKKIMKPSVYVSLFNK